MSLRSLSYVDENDIKYGLKVTSRDPRHRKSMGCRFLVTVSLFIDSHQSDHGQAQGSHSRIPKGTNLEVGYQCAHRKIEFQRWMEFTLSSFPQSNRLLWHRHDFVS